MSRAAHQLIQRPGGRPSVTQTRAEMKFENSNGHTKDWSDVNHNAEQRKVMPGRMSYITVTENAIKWWVTVNGLNHHEVSGIFMDITHHLSSGLMSSDPPAVREGV